MGMVLSLFFDAGVAQLARARPCQGRGQGFEPPYPLQLLNRLVYDYQFGAFIHQ